MAVPNKTYKCSVTGIAVKRLGQLIWGIKCENLTGQFMESYIKYLNCPTVPYAPCLISDDSSCNNAPIIHNCHANVVNISFTTDIAEDIDGDIIFSLQTGDVYGMTPPLVYQWIFDTSDFDAVGATDQPTLTLKLKPGKQIELVVGDLGVMVTDSLGCSVTKTCVFAELTINCNQNYVTCVPPTNLTVTMDFIVCAKPTALQVAYQPEG